MFDELASHAAAASAAPILLPAVSTRPSPAMHAAPSAAPLGQPLIQATWAREPADVRAAQALRHAVFAGEMGAQLSAVQHEGQWLDVDLFDAHCEHLVVRVADKPTAPAHSPGEVVGTYRVLLPQAAQRAGGLYSEGEFDLSPLAPLRDEMAELGRSCVHPDWRQGGVILSLWGSLARFMQDNRIRWVVGCASVSMADGGHQAASLWAQLREKHLAPPDLQVRPHLPLPVERLQSDLPIEPPALIKGYLRCGAWVLGPPAWDPDFGTADLPMLLDLQSLPASYRRRMMG